MNEITIFFIGVITGLVFPYLMQYVIIPLWRNRENFSEMFQENKSNARARKKKKNKGKKKPRKVKETTTVKEYIEE